MRDVHEANMAAKRIEAASRVRHADTSLTNPLRDTAPLPPPKAPLPPPEGHEEVKHEDMIDFLETDQFELRPVDALSILSGHASLT